VRAYHDTYGLPVVISNCSNNYGPFQFPEKLIPLFINNIKSGKALPLYGKGENVRDWLWVEDHARAIDTIIITGRLAKPIILGAIMSGATLVLSACSAALWTTGSAAMQVPPKS